MKAKACGFAHMGYQGSSGLCCNTATPRKGMIVQGELLMGMTGRLDIKVSDLHWALGDPSLPQTSLVKLVSLPR